MTAIGDNQAALARRLYGVYKTYSRLLAKYGVFEQAAVEHAGWEALWAAVRMMKMR
ncbi:hypothetical protein L2D08_05930 [Domibacillus sp. PGB-M46]|uniref:hypothetical protein n=1 Tax=Domibacillus sp. PGB-M46 TaxID=2910255 RepID=UPI001F55DC76|nr:hypothetical protein [Domibacillus sp. PGB-M46]MCI2253899.1 hypothetical protein [Domibacillus sp. PGB-M46]